MLARKPLSIDRSVAGATLLMNIKRAVLGPSVTGRFHSGLGTLEMRRLLCTRPEICNKSTEWLSHTAVSRCGGTQSPFAAPLQCDATLL